MAATSSVSTKFTAIDQYTAKVKRMQAATSSFATRAQTGLAKANRGFRKLTSPIRAVGRQLGQLGIILGATAIIGVVGGAINVFKDFEQANANVASVLGLTSKNTKELQKDAKRLGASTMFTATEVAELQKEYAKLGFTQSQIIDTTESTLYLAQATGVELGQAAKQTGQTLKAFGLTTKDAGRVAGVLGVSTTKAALDMEFFATSMSKVAPIAKNAGFSLEETSALFASLADSGFDASTAATSTKNILLMAADSNSKLSKAMGGSVSNMSELVEGLDRVKNSGADLTEMLNLTDRRSVAAFATFIDGKDNMLDFANSLQSPEERLKAMADAMGDTLQGSIFRLQSAYEGFILSIEDGNGKIGKTIRGVIDVAAEMLTLARGAGEAESKLSEKEKTIRRYAETALYWLEIIGYIVGAFVALKIILVAASTLLAAWNLGVKAVMAAQWLWNAAMSANPIGLIILGIAALIAIIAVVIAKYDEWGAAFTFVLGPLGMIINLIQSFRRNWDGIKKAFADGGILGGIKMIGKVILDSLLMPLQQLLEILASVPGIGGFAQSGADALANFREELGVNVGGESQGNEVTNPRARQNETFSSFLERSMTTNTLKIKDETGRAEMEEENSGIPIITTSTGGA